MTGSAVGYGVALLTTTLITTVRVWSKVANDVSCCTTSFWGSITIEGVSLLANAVVLPLKIRSETPVVPANTVAILAIYVSLLVVINF